MPATYTTYKGREHVKKQRSIPRIEGDAEGLIINTYISLMYELKKNGKVFKSKSVGTGPSSYEKRIYRAAVSQRLRNADLHHTSYLTHFFL